MRLAIFTPFAVSLALVLFPPGCNGEHGTPSTTAPSTEATGTDTATNGSTTTGTTTGEDTSSVTDSSAATTEDPTTGAPTKVDKRVFITAATFHGDLMQQGGAADGVAGADALCQSAATQAGLDGTWIAWVSSSTVDAITRLSGDGRWTLVDGTTEVFAARSEIQLGPKHAIDRTEADVALLPSPDPVEVWTNTGSLGRNSDDVQNDACDDWTGQVGTAAVGVLFDPQSGGPGQNWTDTKQPRGCGGEYHLYCLEP